MAPAADQTLMVNLRLDRILANAGDGSSPKALSAIDRAAQVRLAQLLV